MVKIPYQDIIQKIHEVTNIPKSDIEAKIDDKLAELSGLLSKEGAAHIIANQYKVDIIPDTSKPLQLKDIVAGLSGCSTTAKIIQKYDMTTFKRQDSEGKVQSLLIADQTGRMRITFWDNMVEQVADLEVDDIIHIQNVISRANQGRVELSVNAQTTITKNPEGVTIDSVAKYQEPHYPYVLIKDVGENGMAHVAGTIVQAFNPNFFIPKNQKESKDPQESQVMNLVLDDGTGSIRIVLFGEDVLTLLKISQEKILAAKQDTQNLSQLRQEVIGKFIAIKGRVTTNSMFERKEIVANSLLADVDVQEYLKLIKKYKQ